jgi:hypothetical protein
MRLENVLKIIAVAVSFVAGTWAADGINCNGNIDADGGRTIDAMYSLLTNITGANTTNFNEQVSSGSYDANNHVACIGNTCLFPQKTNKATPGSTLITLLHALRNHCSNEHGSVPLTYSTDSDGNVSGM